MNTGLKIGLGVITAFALLTRPDIVLPVLALAAVLGWHLRKRGVIR